MSKYKAGDKVVLGILSIDGDGYYIVGSEHYSWWASPKNLDEVVEPLSTYTDQLNDKIKRQEEEITRLIAENVELKNKYKDLNKALDDFNDDMCKSARAEGQQEAWELAKKIALVESEGGYSSEELDEIFGRCQYLIEIFNLTYTEAAAKVAEWEQKKEEICVGDVLSSKTLREKCIVTSFAKLENTAYILWMDGSSGKRDTNKLKEEFEKIGHIDIASMLAQIGGEHE